MKTLNRKNISVALLITMGTIFSVNANAAETNTIENSISEMVVAQGERVMNDLSAQLQQSICDELNRFTIDFSFDEAVDESIAWLTDEQAIPVAEVKNTKQDKSKEQPESE
jgi:small basic protein